MSVRLAADLKAQLVAADDHRCVYCQTTQACSGYPMVTDHIMPSSKGGKTEFSNLCLSCHRCNLYKHITTEVEDPLTGRLSSLFHPRRDIWAKHFQWDAAGIRIQGLTAQGRVTVIALNMNNDVIVDARRNWVRVGWHPPQA
ncbi:MAG: HNH endonuclease [Caldilineales bacterium]|nr:HNH endonuclease [Caldilineales bacterium]